MCVVCAVVADCVKLGVRGYSQKNATFTWLLAENNAICRRKMYWGANVPAILASLGDRSAAATVASSAKRFIVVCLC